MVGKLAAGTRPSGLSLIELIVAIGLFAILAAAAGAAAAGAWPFLRQAQRERAAVYADEAAVALGAIAGTAFNTLATGSLSVAAVDGAWAISPESSEIYEEFTRRISMVPAYRTPDGSLAEAGTPYAAPDILTYLADTRVEWTEGAQARSVVAETVMSAWNAKRWQQTDWSGGPGTLVWASDGEYDADDGSLLIGTELSLVMTASDTRALSGELVSAGYDIGAIANFVALHFEADIPDGSGVEVAIQTAPEAEAPLWPPEWSGPDGENAYRVSTGTIIPAVHNGARWVRYRLRLTGNGQTSPTVHSVTIRYQ